jgi:ketosteroid isomerase-like protein
LALSLSLPLPLPLRGQDTTTTKLVLLAADRCLATDLAVRGAGAFFEHVASDAAVLIPEAPIYRGAEARAPWLARYAIGGSRFLHEAQHAVAGLDGNFGCTVGVTRFFLKSDSSQLPRVGRYIACWRRASIKAAWKVVGYTRTNDAQGAAVPAEKLDYPPHSATARTSGTNGTAAVAATADELRSAQDADAAFAAVSAKHGPAEAFGTWSAADAMMLGPAPKPRQGPAVIRDAFKNFPKDGTFAWAPIRSLGDAGGGLAFTSGEAHNVAGGTRSNTKYFTVWRREPNGSWRFIFDSGSGRP